MSKTITIKEAEEFLEEWYDHTMKNPSMSFCPMLVSPPGIGKTSIINQLAAKKGVNVTNIILSQAQPSEAAGMAMPINETRLVDIYDPKWVDDLADGDILFFDEVMKAPQAILNACLTMIQERRLASGRLLPKVAIISAANPIPNMGSYAPEVKQRFPMITIEFQQVVWKNYIGNKYGIPASLLDRYATCIKEAEHSSTQWNFFTPRDAEKLLAWALEEFHEVVDKEDFDTNMKQVDLRQLVFKFASYKYAQVAYNNYIQEALENLLTQLYVDTYQIKAPEFSDYRKELNNIIFDAMCVTVGSNYAQNKMKSLAHMSDKKVVDWIEKEAEEYVKSFVHARLQEASAREPEKSVREKLNDAIVEYFEKNVYIGALCGSTATDLCSMSDTKLHKLLTARWNQVGGLVEYIRNKVPGIVYSVDDKKFIVSESKPKPKWRKNLERAIIAYAAAEGIVSLNGVYIKQIDCASDVDLISIHDNATVGLKMYFDSYDVELPF